MILLVNQVDLQVVNLNVDHWLLVLIATSKDAQLRVLQQGF